MNKCSWSEIEAGLKNRKTPAPRNDAEAFRQDFKAHAALVRQSPASVESRFPEPLMWLLQWRSLPLTALAAGLVLVGVLLWPTSASLVTQIKSLQVFAPHSGVIIMTDEENKGTVVWVTDMDPGEGNRG